MKKLVRISTLMLVAALIFAGCKKDKNNEPQPDNFAAEVEGSYNGAISMGTTPILPSATITLTRINNDSVTVAMNETIPGMGPLSVSCPAKVSEVSQSYGINGKTKIAIQDSEYDVTITGLISKEGAANLEIVTMGGAVTVNFTGQKQ